MKILLIDNSPDITGASKALIKAVKEMQSDDCQFIFAFPKASRCASLVRGMGYECWELDFLEINKSVSRLLLYLPVLIYNAFKLARLTRQHKVDLVHVNDIYNLSGLALKAITGTPVITYVRRMPESFPRGIFSVWAHMHAKFADRIVGVSKANQEALVKNHKTSVIYDSLPEPEKEPAYTPRSLLNKSVSLLYLANYTRGKGHEHALEMLKIAVKDLPDWRISLNFYGGDLGLEKNRDFKRELSAIALNSGLSSFVQFHEKCENPEKIMKAHDIVLNLSDSESFSRVTLEALFFGVPILATDVGGTREMVVLGRNGFLVPPKDTGKMLAELKKLLGNDELRVAYAINGYSFVRQYFNVEATSLALKTTYKKLLDGR